MTAGEQHFLAGLTHHKAGRASEAERCYRAALALEPEHFAALQHLGALSTDRGAVGEAAALFEKASRLNPADPVIFYQLGSSLTELGRFADALAAFDAAIALKSDIPLLHAGRGSVLHALNRHAEAIEAYDRALTLRPKDPLTIANRAAALRLAGRGEDALLAINQSLTLNPNDPNSLVVRGLILMERGETDKALADFDRALALRPEDRETLKQLGFALWACAAYEAVVEATSQTLRADRSNAEAYALRGSALYGLGRFEAAIADCSEALARDPAMAAAWHNRANSYLALNRFDAALADSERALALEPDLIEAAATRFTAAACLCDFTRRGDAAVDLKRCCRTSHLPHPFPLLYLADDPALHLAAARAAASPVLGTARPRPPRERLRVGYMSPDFRDHVVAHQIVEVLERHDRTAFETVGICLYAGEKPPFRGRIVKAFDRFVETGHLRDTDLAQTIAALDLDIVVDLAGDTAKGRAKALARRPAPVAVNYLGHPGTSGAGYIDYIVADAMTIPPEAEEFYTEKIARLPVPFMPRDTTVMAGPPPSRAEAGLPQDGVVFGAFCNSYKMEPEMFDVWMRLLKAVPGSVLWFSIADETARANLRRHAAARDVAPERLVFAGRIADRPSYLGRLKLIDVFLDTRCYGAHATASDLLWAGVPLVTVTGASFATRVGASMLTSAGLHDLIAADLPAYERIARALADDPARRAVLRARLAQVRDRLFDMSTYIRALESAYRTMTDQCRAGQRASFTVALP